MIKHIQTLKTDLADKDIYVWDTSKRASWTFTYLAYRCLPVKGFVSSTDTFAGEPACGNSIMGLPVISAGDLSKLDNALLAFDDEVPRKVMDDALKWGEGLLLRDMFDYHPDLYEGSHWLYGAGAHAWTLLKRFTKRGIRIDGFLVTDKADDMPDEVLGLPIKQFDPADPNMASSIIVTPTRYHDPEDIPAYLERCGYSGDLYIYEFIRRPDMWASDTFIMLNKAMNENRRILLCCKEPMAGELIEKCLRTFGLQANRYVTPEDIYDLADEDPAKSTLIVHSFDRKIRFDAAEAAKELGFSPEYGNFATTGKSCYDRPMAYGEIDYEYDRMLEASIDYTPLGGKPGWAVYGDEAAADTKIMVLGGSTSTDVFRFESWASKLQRLCEANGKRTVIYNGAKEKADAAEELVRLTRDIKRLAPDIVITLSGLNDTGSPANKFEKFRDERVFDYWKRIEGYSKMIAEAEGAKFFCFLQPINGFKPDPDFEHNLMFVTDSGWIGRSFTDNTSSDDFYYDLLRLFHDVSGMFVDQGHYSEAGAAKIAEIVYDVIKGDL